MGTYSALEVNSFLVLERPILGGLSHGGSLMVRLGNVFVQIIQDVLPKLIEDLRLSLFLALLISVLFDHSKHSVSLLRQLVLLNRLRDSGSSRALSVQIGQIQVHQ